MKLVEAEQPRLRRQFVGNHSDRVLVGMFAELHFLPDEVNALVNVEHELVKMRAAFSPHRTALKKQVHEHRLAASDVAVDIEALDRQLCLLAACKQPAERRGISRGPMLGNPRFQLRQFFNNSELRIVTLDAAGGEITGVTCCDGARHQYSQN